MMQGRKKLGANHALGSWQEIFETDGGLIVDDYDQSEIVRKRVFFDDVILITRHHHVGSWFVAICLALAGLFSLMALLMFMGDERLGAAIIFIGVACPFWIPALLRIFLGYEVITVYGSYTKAQMRFMFRKTRANQIYTDLIRKIRQAQSRQEIEAPIVASSAI